MPFQLIRQDITKIKVDAIVNPTDSYFSHGGGTDKQIHEAAGPKLYETCNKLKPLEVGECEITKAYDMKNTKYVIHTYGPIYIDGKHKETEYLYACYKNALDIATNKKLNSIAFPLISSGTFSFPKGEALSIATKAITDHLVNNDLNIYLVVYDKSAFDTSKRIFSIIEDCLNKDNDYPLISNIRNGNESIRDRRGKFEPVDKPKKDTKPKSILETKFKVSEPYYEYLQKLISEKDLKDSEVYKKANIDRRHWNKIINGKNKSVEKQTAIAIAMGLELDIEETRKWCEKVGYSFIEGNTFDDIIMRCIQENIYDVNDINQALNFNNLPQLGSGTKD